MKKLFLISLILAAQLSFAQTGGIPENIRSAFEGKWIIIGKHYTNTVKIHFEPGKDYALFTDIGSGKAPPRVFQALFKGNILIIPARRDHNDYLEMEVIQRQLHLRIRAIQWDENGNMKNDTDNKFEERIFKRSIP